jgi:signal transduction histidine kinase
MGLRICRSIIESHGGRLWVVRSLGRGATFQFNLPAAVRSGAHQRGHIEAG